MTGSFRHVPYTAAGIALLERAVNAAIDAAEADGLLVKRGLTVRVAPPTGLDIHFRRINFLDEQAAAYTVVPGHEVEVQSRIEAAIEEAMGGG